MKKKLRCAMSTGIILYFFGYKYYYRFYFVYHRLIYDSVNTIENESSMDFGIFSFIINRSSVI